jgi:anti-sigma factor (TIGR02949 family)
MTRLHSFSCKEAFARLADFVDRELSPEEMALVKLHLNDCAGCAREFRFEEGMLQCIRERLARVAIPPDLTRRILGALASAEDPPAP